MAGDNQAARLPDPEDVGDMPHGAGGRASWEALPSRGPFSECLQDSGSPLDPSHLTPFKIEGDYVLPGTYPHSLMDRAQAFYEATKINPQCEAFWRGYCSALSAVTSVAYSFTRSARGR